MTGADGASEGDHARRVRRYRRKQKLMTALSTAARVLAPLLPREIAYAQVRFDCPSLRRLRQAPPATVGLTPSRMTSLVSELVFVLRELGLHEPAAKRGPLVSSSLQVLHDALPQKQQLGTVDFFRYLDTSGTSPEAVTSQTLVSYGAMREDRTLCPDIKRRMNQVTYAWNWAQKYVQGWPTVTLSVECAVKAGRLALPLTELPVTFQEDVIRYTDQISGSSPAAAFFEDPIGEDDPSGGRRLRVLRPASIKGRIRHIRCAARALTLTGTPAEQIRSLRDLVSPPAQARAILEFYLNRNNGKSSPSIEQLAESIRLIARDYCRVPISEVRQITAWTKNVRMPKRNGLTEKNRRRLRELMAPRSRAMLLHMSTALMREALAMEKGKGAARLAMYAVAFEILVICPMRITNLAELRTDQHLHRPDPRKPRITHIFLAANETKNGEDFEWPIPPETARLINTYMMKFHHCIAEPGNPFLFPSKNGGGRDAQSIATWISTAVARYIGVKFNVHLIRHFSAWNYLRQNPGQYETVRRVLGHKDIDTTIRFYVGLEVDASAKQFDAYVLKERQATRGMALQAFRAGRGGRASLGRENRT
jgi:integrase